MANTKVTSKTRSKATAIRNVLVDIVPSHLFRNMELCNQSAKYLALAFGGELDQLIHAIRADFHLRGWGDLGVHVEDIDAATIEICITFPQP